MNMNTPIKYSLLACLLQFSVLLVTAPNVMNNMARKMAPVAVQIPTTKSPLQQQIHISIGYDPTEIIVMWATASEEESVVSYYSEKTKSSPKQVTGKTLRFKENRRGLQYLHRTSLKNLIPGVTYYYNVGVGNSVSKSVTFRFTVPSLYSPHTYMVYGDLGTHSTNLPYLVHEAKAFNYTAIFHIGDIAYDLGRNGGKIGDKFLNMIQKMAAEIPYMTIPGDHDLFEDIQYRYRFSHPNADWPLRMDQLWYSFDMGKTHFVAISTEAFITDPENVDKLIKWLHYDLDKANSNRDKYPWVIAMAHRPIYCSMDDPREDCKRSDSVVRKNLEDIYFKYGVDVIFSGHEHLYERTWPVYKNAAVSYNYIDPKAPVQIIIGSLGNQYLVEHASKAGGGWSAFRKSEMELELYGRLTVHNHSHLSWEARSAMDNRLVDNMLIIQRIHGGFASEKVFIPDPLGAAGKAWRDRKGNMSDDSMVNVNFFLFYDDYNTRVTVLTFTSIILVIGIILRKKVMNFFRFCCLKNEPCNSNLHNK